MQHHGLQDYASEDELETVHDRSMTATENPKAVKRGKPAEGMPTKHAVKDDGTLSKLSLGRLNTSLSTFADAARDMEAQLMTATTSSDIISPVVIQRFTAVKCEGNAESAGLELYKENNRDEDTVNVVKAAMAKLKEPRNQFKVIKKMLKAMQPNPIPAESQCE